MRAAVAGGDEEALDALGVVVRVESADEEHGVDVGGDDLFDLAFAGGLAGEAGAAGEQGVDLGALAVGGDLHGDPVADGGVGAGVAVGGVVEFAGEFAEEFAVGGLDGVVVAAEFDDDAGGFIAGGGVRGEGGGPGVVPAVGAECVGGVNHGLNGWAG